MSVHPIESRYYAEPMRQLFTDDAKLQYWLTVEAALAKAHAQLKHIPAAAAAEISRKANLRFVKPERVRAIEAEIQHDLMAMVRALTEVCDADAGKYVHLGATSSDIKDTALALQLTAARQIVAEDLRAVCATLVSWAERTRTLVCVGRTHGQHAVPTTYGLKFAILACEFQRHRERLEQLRPRIAVGKMTGAVGTQASFGPDAAQLQEGVMRELGLQPALSANQVLQRDRHAELIFVLALAAASGEKIAREIRNLQRTEIGELAESFQPQQVGSSAMPQKRNPQRSERICSLARMIRALVAPALENVPLEHERDLTHSAAERIIFPEACILTDYLLRELQELLQGLAFRPEAIQRNLRLTRGLIMSERLMLKLVEKGLGRQEAHEIMRLAANRAFQEQAALQDVLGKDPTISRLLSAEQLTEYLDPERYISTAVAQVDQVLAVLRQAPASVEA